MDTNRMKRLSVVAAVVLMLMMALPRGEGSAQEVSMSLLASCVPDCHGMDDFDMVADPLNCTNYYLCTNGEPTSHPNSCGENSHFDQDSNTCVVGTDCVSVCSGGGSGCAITCDGNFEVVSNPFDCHTYYICNPTEPVLVECTDEFPHFDGTDCIIDDSVCCPPYCDVYCDGSASAFVPDPEDCGSYYACRQGVVGYPGLEFKFSCDPGEYFNITRGYCVTGDPSSCTTLCDAAMGSTTTTTTTTTTTSTGDCVSSFTCSAAGYFPACQTCQPEFFECAGAGVPGVLGTCSDGTVFNPTPDYGFCLLPENCPYP